ncbi:MAG: hypothetical protein C0467_23870 [Planctomycetaceae bacterium]|nr:hypothetical protein [Planctomycetaceae bacterium]
MLLYEDHKQTPVYSVAFSPDGSSFASGARDGSVFLRRATGERHPVCEAGPDAHPIYTLGFNSDGSTVFVGGAGGWSGMRFDGKFWVKCEPSNVAPVTSLALLDDRTLAVGVGDRVKTNAGKFELWDVPTGERRTPLFTEPNGVRAVAVCPAKRTVAWVTGYHKVRVWEIIKTKPIDFPQPKPCPSVAISPDGKQVAAAVDYSVKVYGLEKRQQRLELKGHKGQVSAVAFSPDGETIATGSWDQTVKLWDAATGRERTTFRWPIGRVYCLAYAPDGLRLAAGGDGDRGSVVVWDME